VRRVRNKVPSARPVPGKRKESGAGGRFVTGSGGEGTRRAAELSTKCLPRPKGRWRKKKRRSLNTGVREFNGLVKVTYKGGGRKKRGVPAATGHTPQPVGGDVVLVHEAAMAPGLARVVL